MQPVKVSPKYQVVIPKRVRESVNPARAAPAGHTLRRPHRTGARRGHRADARLPGGHGPAYRARARPGVLRVAADELNLVDSSGWVEFFTDGPNAPAFAAPLADPDRLVVPTVSAYEVFRVILRQRGKDDALRAAAQMSTRPGGAPVVRACPAGRTARPRDAPRHGRRHYPRDRPFHRRHALDPGHRLQGHVPREVLSENRGLNAPRARPVFGLHLRPCSRPGAVTPPPVRATARRDPSPASRAACPPARAGTAPCTARRPVSRRCW